MAKLLQLGNANLAQVSTALRGKQVPNQFPVIDPGHFRLAVIGEAPGAEEDKCGVPFSGASGRFLNVLLHKAGLKREQVFVGNICQHRPPNNKIDEWGWNCPEIDAGLEQLQKDLSDYKPNCVLLLGKYALRASTYEWRPIGKWRGSLHLGTWDGCPWKDVKALASYHPAAVLRQYKWHPYLRFDILRAVGQCASPELNLPKRNLVRGLSFEQIIALYDGWLKRADDGEELDISYDLEGYWNRITRWSLAPDPWNSYCVPLTDGEYGSMWAPWQEAMIWQRHDRLMRHPRIKKTLQNSLYDHFVLAYRHRIIINNVHWDTQTGHWELYCELEQALNVQASIYTFEPYWKDERDDEDLPTREIYCCKDSAVTAEIRDCQMKEIREVSDKQRAQGKEHTLDEHMQINMVLKRALLYMELRGMNYDVDGAKVALAEKEAELYSVQHQFNISTGHAIANPCRQQIFELVKAKMCKKREQAFTMTFGQIAQYSLKDYREASARIAELDKQGKLNDPIEESVIGEIEFHLEHGLNVDSNPQMCDFLYVKCKYERQWKENKDGKLVLTADVDAILALYVKYKDERLRTILKVRSLLYLCQTLRVKADPDGRIRCAYKLTGTETGRLACYESPTGSGYNLQTVTKSLRYLFRSDPGHWFFQCDLAGADGWTVAAWCKAFGDATMMDDYKFGLKPAKIIALMYQHGERINSLGRDELLAWCDKESVPGGLCDSDGWLYFGSKRVQHSGNYGAGDLQTSRIILKDSHKLSGVPIYIEPVVIGRLRAMYLTRYWGIKKWWEMVATMLLSNGEMESPSGHIRTFFGRIREPGTQSIVNHETKRAALSHEPQFNTTDRNNMALYKLWMDPENRRENQSLIIENLHHVHDALNGQFPKKVTDWAVHRIATYYNNPIKIAGQEIVIPFEGAFGRDWKHLDQGKIKPIKL